MDTSILDKFKVQCVSCGSFNCEVFEDGAGYDEHITFKCSDCGMLEEM